MIKLPNGGNLFDFQKRASKWLFDNTSTNGQSETLILKSPTGSGKTIILLDYINDYLNYNTNSNMCFIWLSIGTGELEEQSMNKMIKILPHRNAKTLEDSITSGFESGDVTFINWEAVNRRGNKSTTLGEMKNVIDRIKEAHKAGLDFIVIIDEEHRSNTEISANFIVNFSPEWIIRVSATPIKNENAKKYEIPEYDVIQSGLITQAMYVNQDVVNQEEYNIRNEYEYLINLAINKREEIQLEYNKLNKNIRPLVIIQFPDSSNDKIKEVEDFLERKGYTYENGLVAKWLSETKTNIEDIELNNSTPIFLLWKQALSTGWDCPRAKILVKLRDNMSDSFEIQTIGRIRRMPEIRHYDNELLDNCYMYTFDEEWKEKALSDPNAFETKRLYIKEEGKELKLKSEVRNSSSNNFGEREVRQIVSSFIAKKYHLQKGNQLSLNIKEQNKRKMEADSWVFGTEISHVFLKGKFVKVSDLLTSDKKKHAVITREAKTHDNGRDVMNIINELHSILSMSDSVVRSILKTLFHRSEYRRVDNLIALDNVEWYAFIINNREKLKELFREIKATDLSNTVEYEQFAMDLNQFEDYFKNKDFKIPLSEVFKYDSSRFDLKNVFYNKNIYHGYQVNMSTDKTRSTIEQKFEKFCEEYDSVDWFYKNGDKGDRYFSIAYRTGVGQVSLFYPDYIIQMKNEDIWIIETKGGERHGTSDNIDDLANIKFEAFKQYSNERNTSIKWGFVRNIGEHLFINNTSWTEKISMSDEWKPISEIFK